MQSDNATEPEAGERDLPDDDGLGPKTRALTQEWLQSGAYTGMPCENIWELWRLITLNHAAQVRATVNCRLQPNAQLTAQANAQLTARPRGADVTVRGGREAAEGLPGRGGGEGADEGRPGEQAARRGQRLGGGRGAGHSSLLIAHRSSLSAQRSALSAQRSALSTRPSLLVPHPSPLIPHHSSLVAHHLSFVAQAFELYKDAVAAELEGYGPEAFDQTIEYSDPSPDNKARAHSREGNIFPCPPLLFVRWSLYSVERSAEI